MIPTPLCFPMEEPSTYNFRFGRSAYLLLLCSGYVSLVTKSTKARPLIAVLGRYSLWYSPSSIDHVISRLEISGQVIILFRGWLVRTMIEWVEKYGLSFLSARTNDRASFSSFE